MNGFFDSTRRFTELSVLRERITAAEGYVALAEEHYAEAQSKRESINAQLADANGKVRELETQRSNKQTACSQKQKEIEDSHVKIGELEEKIRQFSQENEQAKAEQVDTQSKLKSVTQQAENFSKKIAALDAEIKRLDDIIAGAEPEKKYAYFCHNGIENCQNHPLEKIPRLTNEAEIEGHKQEVEKALAAREHIVAQRSDLYNQYSALQAEANPLQEKLRIILDNIASYSMQLDSLTFQLDFERRYLECRQSEYQNLLDEDNQLATAISDMRYEVGQLSGNLAVTDDEMSTALDEEVPARSGLEQLRTQYEEISNGTESKLVSSGGLPAVTDEAIAQMAQAELVAEEGLLARLARAEIAAENAVGKIMAEAKGTIRGVKEVGADILTTAGDLWPAPVGMLTEAMFNGPHGICTEFFGVTPAHTGNILVDKANKDANAGRVEELPKMRF